MLSPSIVIPASSLGVLPLRDSCGLMCKAVNCWSLIIYVYTFFTSLLMSKKKTLCIEAETLELLKQLLKNGFVYTKNNRNKLHFLQKNFRFFSGRNYLILLIMWKCGENLMSVHTCFACRSRHLSTGGNFGKRLLFLALLVF